MCRETASSSSLILSILWTSQSISVCMRQSGVLLIFTLPYTRHIADNGSRPPRHPARIIQFSPFHKHKHCARKTRPPYVSCVRFWPSEAFKWAQNNTRRTSHIKYDLGVRVCVRFVSLCNATEDEHDSRAHFCPNVPHYYLLCIPMGYVYMDK